jgi:hypothetical protein
MAAVIRITEDYGLPGCDAVWFGENTFTCAGLCLPFSILKQAMFLPSLQIHGVTSQKRVLFIVTDVRTSN